MRVWQMAEVIEKRLLHLKYGYFSYKKRMDSLQEAFIHLFIHFI